MTPRQRAFAKPVDGWSPRPGDRVFVRSREHHLSRVCGRGEVLQQGLFKGFFEVVVRSGWRKRTDLWSLDDLRPCEVKS